MVLREHSITQDIFDDKKISPSLFTNKKEKPSHVKVDTIDDEYGMSPEVVVDIQEEVILKAKIGNLETSKDITESLRSQFSYLSATGGLELDTERVNFLQSYVDRMLQGNSDWEGKARVIIINKALEPTAFVYPEGSIFISQSLINLYDSLDEVVAVLAHEVKHLTNGTVEAAFNSQFKRGSTLGVDWLHEMTSDFGSPELLEKIGLKSTATADMLSGLANHFGNVRGREHQAPVVRALEQLMVHYVKDYETSHISYTELPEMLRREAKATNFELIIDAVSKDDIDSVKQYLTHLHPRDLGKFFTVVDRNSYYGLSDFYPTDKTTEELVESVVSLVVKRLSELGLTREEIKVFFFSFTHGGSSKLSAKFKDLAELTTHVEVAERMNEEGVLSSTCEKVFGVPKNTDPLFQLVRFVESHFNWFTDEKILLFTQIDDLAGFVGAVSKHIKGDLPQVDKTSNCYVDIEGNRILIESNRATRIQNELENVIFEYIERYFINHVPDGELDQNQIEDIFEAVKEAGFEPTLKNYFFPINDKKIGPRNKTIIEFAFKKVFGVDLLVDYVTEDIVPLPSLTEFRSEINGMRRSDIDELFRKYAREHNLENETRVEYARVVLDRLDDQDFRSGHLQELIQKKIGYTAMRNWNETGDPSLGKFDLRLRDRFTGSEQNDKSEGSREERRFFSLDDLIEKYNLNREELYAAATKKAEFDRVQAKIAFIAGVMTTSEQHLLDISEEIMQAAKVDMNELSQMQLLTLCRPLFSFTSDKGRVPDRFSITDFDMFYKLKFVQEIVQRVEEVRFDSIQDLLTYTKRMKLEYSQSPVFAKVSLYEDDVYSVLLTRPLRNEILRLSQPGSIIKEDYPALVELLNDHFPASPQRRNLTKVLQELYISDPSVPILDKINFFFKEYKLLGFEGAIAIAEQISEVDVYKDFKLKLDGLALDYISGDEGLDEIAVSDIAGTVINRRGDLLIKTTSDSAKVAKETSTDLAIEWVKTYTSRDEWKKDNIVYDESSGKFILSGMGRTAFVSFSDTISYFRGLPDGKRLAIALKAMSDQDGLLVTEEGRALLEKMLTDGLGLTDQFFNQVLRKAVRDGDAKVIGLPASQMLVPFLFRSLSVDKVDLNRLGNVKVSENNDDKDTYRKVKHKSIGKKLPSILSSSTRELRYFGAMYRGQIDSDIAMMAQESGQVYFDTLENLRSGLIAEEEEQQVELVSEISPATESMIKAGETSPLFVRGMQMGVQLVDFDPAVQDRLSKTQDSMKGMEKLRFWDNLLSKAENDPELARFIEEDLITLDSYLGGGSLFTTYGATVKGKNGQPEKVVVKMLNPNAEEFIRLSYEFSSDILGEVEQQSKGRVKRNARMAASLLELSNVWCISDINDTNYVEHDDAFRLTVQSFNERKGGKFVESPERLFSSKKVKIERQHLGTTLNRLLSDSEVSSERKSQAVNNLLEFFDYQFDHSPLLTPNGEKLYIFHSDPHAGNYMIDTEGTDQALGVIDRSMYLSLEEKDVRMFKLLKSGNSGSFVNTFISRCLEVSGIEGNEASSIRYRVLNQLGGEFLRQTIGRRIDTANYLQVILQEFARYGERYLPTNETELALRNGRISKNETKIAEFFTGNPETDVVVAYDSLKETLVRGTERALTFSQFKDLVNQMSENGTLKRKSIDVPLSYRLMIRNIVAMNNLKDRWVE